ncbi:RNA polymerase sigma-I factor [Clostridiisalibacter paucivorans]|uniref:RNA polymerase sigma-I factor n=1 Tax=Clostridiisalibacter paucivorans TaxID=408753 RepID=UPI00047D4746|nr:RNA polymerase sigma-I factor [Clostridiisalibacter paucivorans]
MFFKNNLEKRVNKAKTNEKEMNKLLEEYRPFIMSVITKRCGRYIEYGKDDEVTIGMMAFKEAIESFDESKGKFLSFANRVINSRLIDYYRANNRDKKELLILSDEDINYRYEMKEAMIQYKSTNENESRKREIEEFKQELYKWGITFHRLMEVSPKHKKLRETYKNMALCIIDNQELLDHLIKTNRLPIKEIEKYMNIHRKKIERGRIYIIALIIILTGDYPHIKEYIEWR